MIDLIPYLPQETVIPQKKHRVCRFTLSEIVESAVTICLGLGIFFVLTAFVAALWFPVKWEHCQSCSALRLSIKAQIGKSKSFILKWSSFKAAFQAEGFPLCFSAQALALQGFCLSAQTPLYRTYVRRRAAFAWLCAFLAVWQRVEKCFFDTLSWGGASKKMPSLCFNFSF